MLTIGKLGAVMRLPCPSDADPGERENAESVMDAETDIAIELIGRACRAVMRDPAAAVALLRDAAAMLGDIADNVG